MYKTNTKPAQSSSSKPVSFSHSKQPPELKSALSGQKTGYAPQGSERTRPKEELGSILVGSKYQRQAPPIQSVATMVDADALLNPATARPSDFNDELSREKAAKDALKAKKKARQEKAQEEERKVSLEAARQGIDLSAAPSQSQSASVATSSFFGGNQPLSNKSHKDQLVRIKKGSAKSGDPKKKKNEAPVQITDSSPAKPARKSKQGARPGSDDDSIESVSDGSLELPYFKPLRPDQVSESRHADPSAEDDARAAAKFKKKFDKEFEREQREKDKKKDREERRERFERKRQRNKERIRRAKDANAKAAESGKGKGRQKPVPERLSRHGFDSADEGSAAELSDSSVLSEELDESSDESDFGDYAPYDENVDRCEFCSDIMPTEPTDRLKALRRRLKQDKNCKPRPTAQNPHALFLPLIQTASFCRMHKEETEILPDGRARGWPLEIDNDGLKERLVAMRDVILSEVIESDPPSEYYFQAKEIWDTKGARKMGSVLSELDSFEVEQPGYYGPLGYSAMLEYFEHEFVEPYAFISIDKAAPLDPKAYVRRVLVPECAIRLIMEDRTCTRTEAQMIMVESRSYGIAINSRVDRVDESDDDSPRKLARKARKAEQRQKKEEQERAEKREQRDREKEQEPKQKKAARPLQRSSSVVEIVPAPASKSSRELKKGGASSAFFPAATQDSTDLWNATGGLGDSSFREEIATVAESWQRNMRDGSQGFEPTDVETPFPQVHGESEDELDLISEAMPSAAQPVKHKSKAPSVADSDVVVSDSVASDSDADKTMKAVVEQPAPKKHRKFIPASQKSGSAAAKLWDEEEEDARVGSKVTGSSIAKVSSSKGKGKETAVKKHAKEVSISSEDEAAPPKKKKVDASSTSNKVKTSSKSKPPKVPDSDESDARRAAAKASKKRKKEEVASSVANSSDDDDDPVPSTKSHKAKKLPKQSSDQHSSPPATSRPRQPSQQPLQASSNAPAPSAPKSRFKASKDKKPQKPLYEDD